MVKTLISMVCVFLLLTFGAIYETNFVQKQFNEFHDVLTELYQKVDEQTAVEDDVYAVQKNWLDKKRVLHIFIPHNEIKEVDLWLSEAVTLIKNQDYKEALYKIEVTINLIEQISKTFSFRIENIL